MSFRSCLQIAVCGLVAWATTIARAEIPASLNAGFLFDQFGLTLAEGHRTEAAGPFFYSQQQETQRTWAVPPIFSRTTDPELDYTEMDFAYPVLTYDRFGKEYRFQVFQWLAWAGGQDHGDTNTHRFTLFPIYFQQWSDNPEREYFGVFPIYGHLQNRFFRDEVDFVLWPLYAKTVRRQSSSPGGMPDDPFTAFGYRFDAPRKGGIVTYNYLVPIFHLRFGDGLRGWQVWPLVGKEHKEITTNTNEWGDAVTVPGHDHFFALWPVYFNHHDGIGSENPQKQFAVLPLFSSLRSPQRDSTSYLWPLGLTITDDRARQYREIGAPWPFIVFANGPGKTTRRVFPLFGQSSNTNLQSDFYLWPAYKFNRQRSESLDRQRTRLGLFLYSDTIEKNKETGKYRRLRQSFPLFSHRREMDGRTRLQVLAVLEPLIPNSKSIERNYSQIWSLWRAEHNPQTEASSQSLLWNLYRREKAPESKKVSLLFGLFQYESSSAGKKTRLFYVPISGGGHGKSREQAEN